MGSWFIASQKHFNSTSEMNEIVAQLQIGDYSVFREESCYMCGNCPYCTASSPTTDISKMPVKWKIYSSMDFPTLVDAENYWGQFEGVFDFDYQLNNEFYQIGSTELKNCRLLKTRFT
jgi:L-rhamnose mutarotase